MYKMPTHFPFPKSRQDFIRVEYYADSMWPTTVNEKAVQATLLKVQIIVPYNKHHNV